MPNEIDIVPISKKLFGLIPDGSFKNAIETLPLGLQEKSPGKQFLTT